MQRGQTLSDTINQAQGPEAAKLSPTLKGDTARTVTMLTTLCHSWRSPLPTPYLGQAVRWPLVTTGWELTANLDINQETCQLCPNTAFLYNCPIPRTRYGNPEGTVAGWWESWGTGRDSSP
jgi:hypothetical protein